MPGRTESDKSCTQICRKHPVRNKHRAGKRVLAADLTEILLLSFRDAQTRKFCQIGGRDFSLFRHSPVEKIRRRVTAVGTADERFSVPGADKTHARQKIVVRPDFKGKVDIGGGVTEIAVISLGGIVESKSIKVGGDQFNESIVKYVREKYNVLIGERTAESVNIEIGKVFEHTDAKVVEVKGRDLATGLPKVINLSSKEMIGATFRPMTALIDGICEVIEKTPPELAADIIDQGITLAGGGANLKGLDLLIHKETGMPVKIAERPLDCVADGTGKVLENIDKLVDVLTDDDSRY